MAIGLHDAGTLTNPKAIPSNAMIGLDIVQVVPPVLTLHANAHTDMLVNPHLHPQHY